MEPANGQGASCAAGLGHAVAEKAMARTERDRRLAKGARTNAVSPAAAVLPPKWVLYGLFPALLLTAVAFLAVRPVADPDVWFHMALGRYVIQEHTLPRMDIFSSTASGHEWISSGWAASVLLYKAFDLLGPEGTGLALIVVLLSGSAYLSVYFVAVRALGNRGTIILPLLAGILASSPRFTPRPDLWSQLLTAVVSLLLVTARGGLVKWNWQLLALPPVVALWANMHAGFLAGLILVAVYGAWFLWHGRDAFAVISGARCPCSFNLAALALCFGVWMLNPYGYRVLALACKIKAIEGVRFAIYEWMPLVTRPEFNLPWPVYMGFLILLGLSVLTLAGAGRTAPLWQPAAVVFLFAFAVVQRRQIGLAGAAVPALIAPHMQWMDLWFARRRPLLPALAAASMILVCTAQYSGALQAGKGFPKVGRDCRSLPCVVTDFLAQNPPPANMANTYGAGGYLLFFLGPQTKVFIDGRLDVYPAQIWRDYLAVDESAMSVDTFRERYGINTFCVYSGDAFGEPRHIANRLSSHPDWRLVYFDDDYSVFVHASQKDYCRVHAYEFASPFVPDRFVEALRKPENRGQARDEVQRAIETSAHSANALALGAIGAALLGDDASAQQFADEALTRNPGNELIGKYLGEPKQR